MHDIPDYTHRLIFFKARGVVRYVREREREQPELAKTLINYLNLGAA